MLLEKREVEDYNALKAKARRIRKNIERIEMSSYQHDVVTGSDISGPYQKRPIIIKGYSYSGDSREVAALRSALAGIERQINKVEQGIDNIYPVIIQEAVRLKYVDGRSWETTAIELKYSSGGEALRKRVDREFL